MLPNGITPPYTCARQGVAGTPGSQHDEPTAGPSCTIPLRPRQRARAHGERSPDWATTQIRSFKQRRRLAWARAGGGRPSSIQRTLRCLEMQRRTNFTERRVLLVRHRRWPTFWVPQKPQVQGQRARKWDSASHSSADTRLRTAGLAGCCKCTSCCGRMPYMGECR
ncbi:hypothetical protein BD309DRAFT_529129 [Dichomitus squalens]|uniref:Uncharacterized protein n=1 Tax=Dichomitus squalens TaxID=114155 RepID=A0A4Q9Q6W8_9APHY|nr:hypothetical protein BD309DRAFT_529129 [Dichomitus squalens]TBU63202.1 hypothetical protein BD310DRAFT_916971 [Dichomitus squalens]